jgi:hypothetical protein
MMSKPNHFLGREPKLMKFFDRVMKPGRKVIISRFGDQQGESLIQEFRSEFEALIPEMPLMRKDDQLLERQLILCTVYLAIYKTMKKEGKNAEEIWELCQGIVEAMVKSIPRIFRWLAKKRLFSKKEKNREMKSAEISQERQFTDDFVFQYVAGTGTGFDYGLDMTECVMCKFYSRQNAEDFLPHIFAQGDDLCDFRFQR